MRLWSLHPKYLDARGLVAAWREALLAQKVLEGKTRGYTHHPQLTRFRSSADPSEAISEYLWELREEGVRRSYNFDSSKIRRKRSSNTKKIPVSTGQIAYEFELLKWKLGNRDRRWLTKIRNEKNPESNPLFRRRKGEIEDWEKVIEKIRARAILTRR